MKKILFLSLLVISISFTFAKNPFITHMYSADPSARVFNDVLYVYPSHDQDTATWFNMDDWHVYSTTNMKKWKDHGVCLSLKDISWAKNYAWAPDCGYKNGKYYFYYPTDQNYIGVALVKKPYGPFKDPLKKPLISPNTPGIQANRDLIDPCIFIDDDGTPYLYFGQNKVNVVRLNNVMISFNDSLKVLEGTDDFFEAVWMHKYKGKYYLSYSGQGKILYCMADNPYGPFEYKGVVLDEVNSGTNHHFIVQYMGKWYLFYHTSDLYFKNTPNVEPENDWNSPNPFRRSISFDYLHYNDDGTIQQVIQTKSGVEEISNRK